MIGCSSRQSSRFFPADPSNAEWQSGASSFPPCSTPQKHLGPALYAPDGLALGQRHACCLSVGQGAGLSLQYLCILFSLPLFYIDIFFKYLSNPRKIFFLFAQRCVLSANSVFREHAFRCRRNVIGTGPKICGCNGRFKFRIFPLQADGVCPAAPWNRRRPTVLSMKRIVRPAGYAPQKNRGIL